MRKLITSIAVLATALACGGPAMAKGRPNPPPPPVTGKHKPPPVATVRPLKDGNNSAGKVIFTFDDGPGPLTRQFIAKLAALHVPATFFVIGSNITANFPNGDGPAVIASEVANGNVVGNHTWDHPDLTGGLLGPPLTTAQLTSEFNQTSDAIVAAGAPRPTLWRPPYGDTNPTVEAVATSLGLRMVMSWGTNILDSQDWLTDPTTGACVNSAAQLVQHVTQGYVDQNLEQVPPIAADTIIEMHDGADCSQSTLDSLQGIVDYMNLHHFGATAVMRPDATGGQ